MPATTRAAAVLCLAVAMLAHSAAADETVAPDDSMAKERYEKLMEHAEGRGRTCMIAKLDTERSKLAIETFLKGSKFLDLDPAKPIRVALSEDYYNPQGSTVTFAQFEIFINRKNISAPYISLTRVAEGVELEPKIALDLDGKMICVRSFSGTLKYRTASSPELTVTLE